MSDMFDFNDSGSLKKDIKELRSKLSDLLSERDEIIYTECKNIKMEYMLEIGYLENKVYGLSVTYQRLKRKKELVQACIYREKTIDINVIEEILDTQFKSYQKRIKDKMSELTEAIDRKKSKQLSDEELKLFKSMYRKIVKKLHPDVHPNATDEDKELFIRAVMAYDAGDLETMKIIYEVVASDNDDNEDMPKTVLELAEERARLEGLIDSVNKSIDEIKNSYPYNLRVYLDDDSIKRQRQAQLRRDIKAFKEAIDNMISIIKNLLEGRNE